jgi:hypothetical protein
MFVSLSYLSSEHSSVVWDDTVRQKGLAVPRNFEKWRKHNGLSSFVGSLLRSVTYIASSKMKSSSLTTASCDSVLHHNPQWYCRMDAHNIFRAGSILQKLNDRIRSRGNFSVSLPNWPLKLCIYDYLMVPCSLSSWSDFGPRFGNIEILICSFLGAFHHFCRQSHHWEFFNFMTLSSYYGAIWAVSIFNATMPWPSLFHQFAIVTGFAAGCDPSSKFLIRANSKIAIPPGDAAHCPQFSSSFCIELPGDLQM